MCGCGYLEFTYGIWNSICTRLRVVWPGLRSQFAVSGVGTRSRVIQTLGSLLSPKLLPVLWWWWGWWWRRWWWAEMCMCWARTSASLPPAAPLPPLRVEEEEEEAVEEVVVVVEEVPWMARLIQCSMLMLPSRLDEVPPPPPPSSSSQSPPSSPSPSPCPSPSEPEEVSVGENIRWMWSRTVNPRNRAWNQVLRLARPQ